MLPAFLFVSLHSTFEKPAASICLHEKQQTNAELDVEPTLLYIIHILCLLYVTTNYMDTCAYNVLI